MLWYVFVGTRGGENRARLLRALNDQPRNPNQLADDLNLDYTTIRHHLDVLVENDILRNSGDEYGAIYLPSDRAQTNWEMIEEIIEHVE